MPRGSQHSWLLASLSSNGDDLPISVSSDKDSHQDDARFSKVANGVRYSQVLVLYYHAALLATIALCASTHWLSKLSLAWTRKSSRRRQRTSRAAALQHDRLEEEQRALINPSADELLSSGSSTLSVDTPSTASSSGAKHDMDERSPLLFIHRQSKTARPSIFLRLRASLMYQPPPIPLVHKQFPENGVNPLPTVLAWPQRLFSTLSLSSGALYDIRACRQGICLIRCQPPIPLHTGCQESTFAAADRPLIRVTKHLSQVRKTFKSLRLDYLLFSL